MKNGKWDIPKHLDVSNFDFDWTPDPHDPPFIHQFGTQWQKTGGPRFIVPGAKHIKYQSCQHALALPDINKKRWKNIDNLDFDCSWHPDDTEPEPYIYQFPSPKWRNIPGPRYVMPKAKLIKYIDDVKIAYKPDFSNWEIPDYIDETSFDFSWVPPEHEPEPYIYQFSTTVENVPGPRYITPGAKAIKYMDDPVASLKIYWDRWNIPSNVDKNSFDFTWHPNAFDPEPYIYQFGTQWQKTGGPRYTVPGATVVKYVDAQRATVIASTPVLNRRWRGNLSVNFDWSWHPDATSPPYVYQFGTKWNKHAGPRYVVPGATETIYVSDIVATNILTIEDQLRLKQESNWSVPENIDDNMFDYNWTPPEEDSEPYIYQFGTQWQKTGGPRYTVPGATVVKYVDAQTVIRQSSDIHWFISSAFAVTYDFDFSWHPDDTEEPYVYVFGNQDRTSEETPTILYLTPGASQVKYNNTQHAVIEHTPLDIFFVSNGEIGSEDRYGWLAHCAKRDVKRVNGVEGRENALVRAAELSDTDWFFVFPAKLRANENFNFDFQPNRFIEPKHYIFNSKNPINGLEYGHMAAVCYNKHLVLNTVDYGLDFTMSQPHDVVSELSGTSEYNSDVLMTWRTAFREVIKLKLATDLNDAESSERLMVWLTIAEGRNAQWSLDGAKDGLAYYTKVNGNHDELMKTFSWDWLASHYKSLYG